MKEQELLKFIKDNALCEVHIDSILFSDIGMDGLDADIFMDDFFTHFKVEKADFDIDKYRISESDIANIFAAIRDRLLGKRLYTFSVRHLLNVIEKGEWFDPSPVACSNK